MPLRSRAKRRTSNPATVLSEPDLDLLLDLLADEFAERIPQTCVEVRVVLDQTENPRISATSLIRRRRTASLCSPAIHPDPDLLLFRGEAATELRTSCLHEDRGDSTPAELRGAVRYE